VLLWFFAGLSMAVKKSDIIRYNITIMEQMDEQFKLQSAKVSVTCFSNVS
jgi:hypothetical protein